MWSADRTRADVVSVADAGCWYAVCGIGVRARQLGEREAIYVADGRRVSVRFGG